MDDYFQSCCYMLLIILFIISKFLSGKCAFNISILLFFESILFFLSYNSRLKISFYKVTFFSRTPIKIPIKKIIKIFKINLYNNNE